MCISADFVKLERLTLEKPLHLAHSMEHFACIIIKQTTMTKGQAACQRRGSLEAHGGVHN